MTAVKAPKVWFRDAKVFHYVFLPRILFLFLGGAAAFVFGKAIDTTIWDFLSQALSKARAGRFFASFLALTIPSVVMGAVALALMIAHLHKCKKFFAEQLGELTKPLGWKDTLVSKDPAELFQRLSETCKTLGFKPALIIPSEVFLAIRTEWHGFGSLDVVEIRFAGQSNVNLFARPLLPLRVSKNRYRRLVEEIKKHVV